MEGASGCRLGTSIEDDGVVHARAAKAIAQFRGHSQRTQAVRRRTRSEYRLRELVSHRFMDHLEREVLTAGELGTIVEKIAAREVDPYTAANELLVRALKLPNYPITQLPNP